MFETCLAYAVLCAVICAGVYLAVPVDIESEVRRGLANIPMAAQPTRITEAEIESFAKRADAFLMLDQGCMMETNNGK